MKKIFTLLVAAVVTTSAFGQGFSSISVDGALTRVTNRSGVNELNVVVPEGFDFSQPVVINAISIADWELDGALPTDFSTNKTQQIKQKRISQTGSKTWDLTIRTLKPAPTLPLTLTFAKDVLQTSYWTPATESWAFAGIDTVQTGVIRYGNTVLFIVGFSEAPKDVSYKLQVVGSSDLAGRFDVYASADGVTWRVIKSFQVGGIVAATGNAWTSTTTDLQSTDRYVIWDYTTRSSSQNINLNEIVVSKHEDSQTGIAQATTASAFYQSAAGEITFTAPVAKAEVFNLLGGKTAEYIQPSGVVSIADGVKGVALIRVQLEDGTVITRKAVK
jgi:hypothetical protein